MSERAANEPISNSGSIDESVIENVVAGGYSRQLAVSVLTDPKTVDSALQMARVSETDNYNECCA